MKLSFLQEIIDSASGKNAALLDRQLDSSGSIVEGKLALGDSVFPISSRIPRILNSEELREQEQTQASFSYKWKRAKDFYTKNCSDQHDKTFEFMIATEPSRYGFDDIDAMRRHYGAVERILEVGCGSGHYSSVYLDEKYDGIWVGADLSFGIDIASQRLGHIPGTNFLQGNLFNLPFRKGSFDIVHCRGVMHHTPSTKRAFEAVSQFVKPGGEFIFLIYKKNGPVREFTDDLIRNRIKDLPEDEAWEKLMALTKFGKALSELNVEVEIPVDVDLLGIRAGKYNVQRLIYNHFLKAFWKPEWNDDENNIITYDWYHPQYVFRHTAEEVLEWCDQCGFDVESFDDRWVGFTVRARKRTE